ncbi:MAG: hypothetical protein ACYCVZ_05195 [Streptosporangiaceae bacterium]
MTAQDTLPLGDAGLLTLAEHAERLDGLAAAVDTLTDRVRAMAGDDTGTLRGYEPVPAPRWHAMDAEEKAAAVSRLASWVETVLRPSYGTVAAGLAACWPDHRLALITLDWLSELHSVLYLQPKRTASMLAGQAEYQTRLLPAAVEQLRRETTGCQHGKAATT